MAELDRRCLSKRGAISEAMAPARALHEVAIRHLGRGDREAFVAREPDYRSPGGTKSFVNVFGVAGVEWAAERDESRRVTTMVDDREIRLCQEQARVNGGRR
jgi:hypothetical protein